jgi:hypothetical protein
LLESGVLPSPAHPAGGGPVTADRLKGNIMSISSVNGSLNPALIQLLAGQGAGQDTKPATLSALLSSNGPGGSVGISQLSKFISRLDDLAESDPAKFQSMMSDIADELSKAAANETGEAASALSKLADQFRDAAESGSTDALREDSTTSGDYGCCTESGTAAALASLLESLASASADDLLNTQLDELFSSILPRQT